MKHVITALVLMTTPVYAQEQCGNTEKMHQVLANKYGETMQIVGGMSATGSIVEFWGNDDTGTWTVTITDTNGTTCFVAVGDAWFAVPPGDPV